MSLARSSLFFALGTVVSRAFGLIREMVLAAVFGATTFLDSFLIANRIPGLLRDLVAEGTMGASFTKVFTELWEKDPKEAKKLAVETTIQIFLLFGTLVFILMLAAGPIVSLFTLYAPDSYGEELVHQATTLTRILLPFILLMSFSAILSGILHQRGKFFLTAIAPIGTSLGFILGALVLGDLLLVILPDYVDQALADRRLLGLSIGVLIGGMLQAGVQLIASWKAVFKGVPPQMIKGWSPSFRKVLKLMGPMVIGASAGQISVFINTNFATSLGEGVVSQVTMAFRLLHLPIGVFGVAISSAVLPALTRQITNNQNKFDVTIGARLVSASELAVWLLAPSSFVLIFLAYPIVDLLFGMGRFTPEAVLKSSEILSIYGIGVIGYGLTKVWSSFYYSIEKTTYPMMVSLSNVAIGFLLNLLLVPYFEHRGLAMTTASIFLANALFLFLGTKYLRLEIPWRQANATWLALIASFVMGFGLLKLFSWFDFFSNVAQLGKFDLILTLAIQIMAVFVVFAFFAAWRYKKSPGEILSFIRRHKK